MLSCVCLNARSILNKMTEFYGIDGCCEARCGRDYRVVGIGGGGWGRARN